MAAYNYCMNCVLVPMFMSVGSFVWIKNVTTVFILSFSSFFFFFFENAFLFYGNMVSCEKTRIFCGSSKKCFVILWQKLCGS